MSRWTFSIVMAVGLAGCVEAPEANPEAHLRSELDRGSSTLAQTAYLKASNTQGRDTFGTSIALSGDTLVVGANFASNPTAAGLQPDIRASTPGAVYVFVRSGATWVQQASLVASNMGPGDQFGRSVALSGDTLAVGAPEESSASTGVNGGQADHGALDSGAVYVFTRTGSTWTQQAYVKASNTAAQAEFGASLALSGDTLAVGAVNESGAGAAYVFTRAGTTWAQQAFVKASNADAGDQFGASIALHGDTLAVGAPDRAAGAGAVYVFKRAGVTWAQQAFVKASNTDAGDQFGTSVALHGDTLAVGAVNAGGAGAAYVFARHAARWAQQAYVKASNADAGDQFGASVALHGDTLAVGAPGESSAATGIDAAGGQADNRADGAGAVYLFARAGTTWSQRAYVKASNTDADDQFGSSVALSGHTLSIAAIGEASAAKGVDPVNGQADNSASGAGAVYVFR